MSEVVTLEDTGGFYPVSKNTETASQVISIDDIYQHIVNVEQREPQDSDLITVATITPDMNEYSKLIQVGITVEEINQKRIPRGKLRDAGFIFVNRMYLPSKGQDMQKPLINEIIDDDDYGQKILLTGEEFNRLKLHQKSAELEPKEIEAIRRDMISLMQEVRYSRPSKFNRLLNVINLVSNHLGDLKDEFRSKYRDWAQKANEWFKENRSRYPVWVANKPLVLHANKFIADYFSDIFPWTEEVPPDSLVEDKRGFRIETAQIVRGNVFSGVYSPFLDSGFIFPNENIDFSLVVDPNNYYESQRRINYMVLHLASRGISEMGRSQGSAHDQHYINLEEYHQLFLMGRSEEEIKARQSEENKRFIYLQQLDGNRIMQDLVERARLIAKGEIELTSPK